MTKVEEAQLNAIIEDAIDYSLATGAAAYIEVDDVGKAVLAACTVGNDDGWEPKTRQVVTPDGRSRMEVFTSTWAVRI